MLQATAAGLAAATCSAPPAYAQAPRAPGAPASTPPTLTDAPTTAAAPAAEAVSTPAAELLADVRSIASAGVPGPLAVFNERAFVIVVGRVDRASVLPVAVGAEWERGRVVALGHGGMLGAEAMKHEGTARLVANAMRWLARADTGTIGVWRNDSMVAALRAAGFDAQPLQGPWQESLAGHAAVVIDSHTVGEREQGALAEYIRGGGGLLTAGLGWGWLQLNPGRSIGDHPGNLLLREAGIAWCDGTLDPTERGAFTTSAVSEMTHAATALAALERSARSGAVLDAQAGITLTAALRVVPRDHALFQRADALLVAHRNDSTKPRAVSPSQQRPLRRADALERTLVALEVENERRAAPEMILAHPTAAAFPGAVPDDAPRVERRFEIDRTIPGWHSTGLYAAAGEVITVTLVDAAAGLSLRIGAHTDHLWHHERWDRVPDIARAWPIGAEPLRAASAFGGLIYIEVPRKASGSIAVLISGAVEAPRFVLGRTTAEQWLALRDAPAPWGELESSKVIVTVPSGVLRTLADPSEVMRFWDRISDAHATLAAIPLDPPRPHRFVADLQISAGYMHSGYPIMTHLDAADDMVSFEKLERGSWGLLHELGHNHQEGAWTFDGTVEVTCNLFSLHAIDTICKPPDGDRGHGGVNTPPSLTEHLAHGAPFDAWKRDPFLALHMYVQLERAFGWQTYQRVFAEYHTLPPAERPKNEEQKRDQWMVRFSRACGRNLGPFFQAWGVPTSDEARDSIANLPPWMPDDWPKP